MRALRVVGLHEDGKSIVLEDPASRTRFLLPADETLRAAARGDIARLGQIQIELESQMRPREIQARIRAGESVEQVASSAGVSEQRVERFAYPVLLERSRTAELAQSAHPVREDGPDVQTLGEVIAYAFGVRGHDYGQARWDSWRGDDGKWVVVLQWKAGRSDNRAHWSFSPGAHGGTVHALDENAEVLLNPNAYRAPRTVRALDPARDAVVQPTLDSAEDERLAIEAPENPHEEDDDTREIPRVPSDDEAAGDDQPRAKPKKNHPIVPSWEDVLLGVRSQRG
ncbi:septation protein SepH [Amycolatopsis rhabdoformis]|uniref:Septation protein SepH n=1 Tax=Amycolatopsis rhabdoformis TaxID=1448059 RepID=A0ABZ1HZF5_9PSEU|nr:septation protein SepH [Amycolatopsis rhabdoformis]WSE27511.1 septation protein SepH [Amycolatopsis rhabdoformis]